MNNIVPSTTAPTRRTWPAAYKKFLLSRDENLLLKIAPIALLAGSPEIIASNLIPIVGEVADLGGLTLTAVVIVRTLAAVRKYR